ncbi:2,5-diamino-6-(ribosylamino)-4(3H)-pyrimidinone 5'-phosphate reductase [Methermicoccus shengliensis]|uniref:2,5-diamino-6-(ribosylamino)-4(3H)-pyrimidinone 5'-phosphate reductase n=1 Tax=Methermicoccus shengliensis TaxID=660064 RepID=A0A832VNB3_9EURY|nr:2,5-diamino-6-(ribosylamino)-4(3H)-pyrimidinone 5'-phosphate reductase [Methermicoccus shengliensis]KUK04430.1 MAG: 5-amino-6-(5-phosphoribosylamino)uracilreductase [Euryarchaeota archaeon 55_53]KUK30563.1 MAG: 5-amino-6-(5-phosphoribosylamino)uracilreductase [Methanosarcinales archeaon 56_1174]MDI3488091.1 2,5-diamino-6-(ribosylamino)-4(3H)-pyrimidinone 5-phosphate reductase [Methanosarcinales archaeon]MDN5295710.1 2,5-diamino-6-(ribosylamino)-4(3H)-pyrimidinone 5-phosphate reductase [Metha
MSGRRPFVFLNLAMSADGKIATRERRQLRISGEADFERVDELRAWADAVMVGIGTVLADDPSLTVKSEQRRARRLAEKGSEHPIRVVVDSSARIPLDAQVLHRGEGTRVVAVSGNAPPERIEALRRAGAQVVVAGEHRVDLKYLLFQLWKRGVRRLMVEGGGTLAWGLISQGLVDELYTYVGNVVIGGRDAPTSVDGEGFDEAHIRGLELLDVERLDEGVLLRWRFVS